MEKRKLLVLSYEYFPMENANTKIVKNLCTRLAGVYGIDLVTLRLPGTPETEESDGIRILRVPEYSFHREKCTGPVTPAVFARMGVEKVLAKLTRDETRMVERLYERGIRKAVRLNEYDAILSFSAPFPAHGCASRFARETGIPWIAVCFDPYFSNRIFGQEGRELRKQREESVFASASRVLITYPTDRDYLRSGVAFAGKILGMEMPGVAPVNTDEPTGKSGPVCRCCFFGMLYKEIRDPRPTIALFSAAGEDVEMRFAGVISGAEKAEYFPEGCTCSHIGQLSGDALKAEYDAADVLVNIGNAVDNQMPSKIFEYISTGKPIINIYKSPECPTLKYLEKYPAALNIAEGDIASHLAESAEKVRAFCRENKGRRVPAAEIAGLYEENTYDHFAETLRRVTDGAVTGNKTERETKK